MLSLIGERCNNTVYGQHSFEKIPISTVELFQWRFQAFLGVPLFERKRERSDSVLWQKPLHPEKSKKQSDNTIMPQKNFDYITIADRLRTVSWGNDSRPTGVVKPI